MWRYFRCFLTAAVLTTGCESDEAVLSPPPPGPPIAEDAIIGRYAVGSGIISPYRMVNWPDDPGKLIVATGKGESFGQSYVHLLSYPDFIELAAPLEAGRNINDMVWVGDYLIAAARSSNELILVDPWQWRVLDTLSLGFPPVSVAAVSRSSAVVSSTGTDNSVLIVDVTGEELEKSAGRRLENFARDLHFDPERNSIFAIGPNLGLIELDASDLRARSSVSVSGTLSFGSALWNGHVVATDRDGYLHFWQPGSQSLVTVDLADALNVSRSVLPLRGIDPIDVIAVSPQRLVVMNQRRDSLIFDSETGAVSDLRPVARFASGSFAVYRVPTGDIVWPDPLTNRLRRVDVSIPSFGQVLPVDDDVVGVRIRDVVRLSDPSDGMLAALGSDNRLLLLDSSANLVGDLSATGRLWRGPIAAGPAGSILALSSGTSGGNSVWQIAIDGSAIREYPIELSSVYSISATADSILVTSRLTQGVQVLSVDSGRADETTLDNSRPRVGVITSSGNRLIFHDTRPDIGVTWWDSSGTVRFSGIELDQWWSDAYAVENSVVASTYGGSVGFFDDRAALKDHVLIDFKGALKVAPGAPEASWIVSEELGAAIELSHIGREITRRIDVAELFDVAQASADTAWAVTHREIIAFELREDGMPSD